MRKLIATCFALAVCASAASAQVPNFRHVFIIVLENEEYQDVIGNPAAPYLNSLANQNGLAN